MKPLLALVGSLLLGAGCSTGTRAAGGGGGADLAAGDLAQLPDLGGGGALDLFGVDQSGVTYIPVRSLPGLSTIDFWERTGGTAPTQYTFTVGGAELTTRLADPLTISNRDIEGVPGVELYDVYYSNDDGTFNIDGAYLTISGVFGKALPSGGGLNLAEIQLNFSGQAPEFGTIVGSFVALGDNADPTSVGKCIDGDLQTHTTMGNTVGQSERLRITLGFPSTVVIN